MPSSLSHLQVNWYVSPEPVAFAFYDLRKSWLWLVEVPVPSPFSCKLSICALRSSISFSTTLPFFYFRSFSSLVLMVDKVASATPGSPIKSWNSELKLEWSEMYDWSFFKAVRGEPARASLTVYSPPTVFRMFCRRPAGLTALMRPLSGVRGLLSGEPLLLKRKSERFLVLNFELADLPLYESFRFARWFL